MTNLTKKSTPYKGSVNLQNRRPRAKFSILMYADLQYDEDINSIPHIWAKTKEKKHKKSNSIIIPQ